MIASGTDSVSTFDEQGLLVVGPGVLGRLVATLWHEQFPTAHVVAESRTPASHGVLRSTLPFLELRLAQASAANVPRFRHVVFCAPPSQNEDYVGAVRRALEQYWSGAESPEDTATFVFTSSVGVYREPTTPATVLREDAPVVREPTEPGASPSALKLLACEEAVRAANGTVLRLAGLYNLERGPHRFWLSQGKVRGDPEGLISLVSYHDAARAVVAALQQPQLHGEALVVVDGQPLSRRQICEIARQHPLYANYSMPTFEDDQASTKSRPPGKRFDATQSRAKLGQFRYDFESFATFMEQMAGREDVLSGHHARMDRA